MRAALILLPLLFPAVVVAQEAKAPDELIQKLGHEDYQVREDATKELIEMGEKAVPALEKALLSEDLEVRVRAGRALRAIGGERTNRKEQVRKAEPPGTPGARTTKGSSVQIQIQPGEVTVRVQQEVDGEQTVKEYKGASIEELKKKHPELEKHLGGLRFRQQGARDPFDMDKFWKDWQRDFDDDFMRRLREDTRQDMDRMQRWLKMLQGRRARDLDRFEWPRAQPDRPMLGMRGVRPDSVLDAQLQLRGRGIVVASVEKETLADTLGLRVHDVVIELNGNEIRRVDDVARILRLRKEGDVVTAKVIRRTKTVELSTAR
jgi:hypothetical protein